MRALILNRLVINRESHKVLIAILLLNENKINKTIYYLLQIYIHKSSEL